jgi:hypothetical protein
MEPVAVRPTASHVARRRGDRWHDRRVKSVLDDLRRESREADLRMTPAERVALAFRLGRRDLALFAAAEGLSLGEARRRLERARQAGRRRCRCIEELIG